MSPAPGAALLSMTAAPTAVPAVLSSAPNALSLLKALRHCWPRAIPLALVCAAAAAAAAWYLLPPSKHAARTLLRVPPSTTFMFRTAESVPAIGDHQRNQVAMVRSRLVLSAALKQPNVGALGIVQAWPEPLEWLEKEVQADFAVAPEILRISLSGDNAEELKTLVNAIRTAYCDDVFGQEQATRNNRLTHIGGLVQKYQEELRGKQKEQRALADVAGARDSGARDLIRASVEMQYNWVLRELLQAQADLRQKTELIKIWEEQEKTSTNAVVSPVLVEDVLGKDPSLRKAQETVDGFKELIADTIKRSARGDADPALQGHRRKLADAEEALTVIRKRLAPEITEKLRVVGQAEAVKSHRQLMGEVAALQGTEKVLNELVVSLRGKLQSMTQSAAQLDTNIADTSNLEDITKRLKDEELRLRIEVQEAPERYTVLEEAVVTRASDDRRLVLASGGTFAGTFSLVLVGFAFAEFRTRRVNTVDEVVHGLGMNLVGAIPDSVVKAYGARSKPVAEEAQAVLAEAVDATRTMLLRAARTESLRVVMVTSAHSGEGKTSLSTHLAASMAQVGYRTLLIDGDLRNPIAHRVFGLEAKPGFCELLRQEAEAAGVIQATPVDRLWMIPAGEWDTQASRALAREGVLGTILRRFRNDYDFVIIDSSPVLPVVDPLLIGQLADGTILSVLRDVSRMPSVYAAHQRLTAGGVRVLGAVVNGVRGDVYGTYSYRLRAHTVVAAEPGEPSAGQGSQ